MLRWYGAVEGVGPDEKILLSLDSSEVFEICASFISPVFIFRLWLQWCYNSQLLSHFWASQLLLLNSVETFLMVRVLTWRWVVVVVDDVWNLEPHPFVQ